MLSLSIKHLPSCLLLASSSLFATTASIQPVAAFSFSKTADDASPSVQKKSPCNAPDLCSIGHGITLNGSFLWWRASENLESYAQVVTKEHIINPEMGIGNPKGHNQSIQYEWNPGFNLRVGIDTDRDCWDLFSDWTWIHHTTKNTLKAKTDSSYLPSAGLSGTANGLGIYSSWLQKWIPSHAIDAFEGLPIQALFAGPFSKAKVKWDLSYNTFNLEMGKSFNTRSNLLRPFFGLRGTLIEREAKAEYTHYQNPGSLLSPSVEVGASFNLEGFDSASYKTKMNFWGIGPLFGVVDEFKLPHGWRLMGQLAAAFFYGRVHAYDQYSLLDIVNHKPTLFSGSKFTNHNQWSPATNIQMRFGIDWATCFNHQHNEFLIGAAWEQNIWFFHDYSAQVDQGIMNLELGGLTATAQVKF